MSRSVAPPRRHGNVGLLPYRESGLALASVLWAVLILSLIAAVIAGLSRSSGATVDIHTRRAQAEALLDAGINRLIFGLLDPRSPWRADSTPHEFRFSGETLHLTVWYERGKFDLNFSPEASMASLFKAGGASASQASSLARAIVDRRASDGQTSRLFHSVAEVRTLPGMSSALYCRVAPALTVYSQQGAFDASVASGLVMTALAEINKGRFAGIPNTLPENSVISGFDLGGQAVTLRAELTSAGPLRKGLPTLAKEVVVRFTGSLRQPVWRLAVRDGWHGETECPNFPDSAPF